MTGHAIASAQPGGGAFDLVLALHVLSALVSLGAVVITGSYAAVAAREPEPGEAVRSYFRPGVNLPGRALFAVPVLGLVLVAMGGGSYSFGDTWLWASLVLWAVAAVVAEVTLWPGEARIQQVVTAWPETAVTDDTLLRAGAGTAGHDTLRRLCRRVVASSVVLTVVLAAAFALMVSRPH